MRRRSKLFLQAECMTGSSDTDRCAGGMLLDCENLWGRHSSICRQGKGKQGSAAGSHLASQCKGATSSSCRQHVKHSPDAGRLSERLRSPADRDPGPLLLLEALLLKAEAL